MTTVSLAYGTALTPAITSLSSLASDTTVGYLVASSILVDNTTELAVGFDVYLTVVYPNSAPTVAAVNVFLAAYNGSTWADDGYGDAADGTDQTITIGDPTALTFLGSCPVLQNKTTTGRRFRVWDPPTRFVVVVHNATGQTITSGSLRVIPLHYTSA